MSADGYKIKTANLLFSVIFSADKINFCQFAMKMLATRKSRIPIRFLTTLEGAFTRVKMRAVIQKMFYSYHIFLLEQHVVTKNPIRAATPNSVKAP